jgi:hypothetical protein
MMANDSNCLLSGIIALIDARRTDLVRAEGGGRDTEDKSGERYRLTYYLK